MKQIKPISSSPLADNVATCLICFSSSISTDTFLNASTVPAHSIASQALDATAYASTNATQVKRGIEAALS